jgi:hypothetical protein
MKLVNRITDSAFDNFFDDVRKHFAFLLECGFVEGEEFSVGLRETSLTWRRGDVVREALDG